MSTVATTTDPTPERHRIGGTIVPTIATKRTAERLVRKARESCGSDAVVAHLAEIEPRQIPALVGLLLNTIRHTYRAGRPRMPLLLTEEQRLKGYAQYRRGVRNEFAVLAYREYQRVNQRRRRDELRDPVRAGRGVVS